MDLLELNRQAWDRQAGGGGPWNECDDSPTTLNRYMATNIAALEIRPEKREA
jgi:hypothetical protein